MYIYFVRAVGSSTNYQFNLTASLVRNSPATSSDAQGLYNALYDYGCVSQSTSYTASGGYSLGGSVAPITAVYCNSVAIIGIEYYTTSGSKTFTIPTVGGPTITWEWHYKYYGG